MQATEDGFQRIREVTGLTDVMDIVHKLEAQQRLPTPGEHCCQTAHAQVSKS